MYIHSTPPAQALLLGFNGTNSNFAGSKGGFTAEPQKFSLTPIRIWTSLMARNSQHCSEFLEKKKFKNGCLHCAPALVARRAEPLEGSAACSRDQRAKVLQTKASLKTALQVTLRYGLLHHLWVWFSS